MGVSGGIDSALVLTLCIKALGKERVRALLMPEQAADIQETIKQYLMQLKVNYEIIPIRLILEAYERYASIKDERLILGNLKARIRMTILYSRSNAERLVVMGTGNRSEILAGYYTKYGDGGVDFLPIGDLYKAQVRGLARHLNLPDEIISQAPSAGLWEGQTDEQEMGITYDKLDVVLSEHFDNNVPFEQIRINGISMSEVQLVKKLSTSSSFKASAPPICPIK
jgi:NAD+ synthase